MSIGYNLNIPAASDIISQSQGQIQTNFNAINSIWQRDHFAFSNGNAGYHNKITFPILPPTPPAQSGQQSVLFPYAGTASSAADLKLINANGNFPVNTLRVLGSFTTTNSDGVISLNTGFNVTSNQVTVTGSGSIYTIAIPANIITGTNVAVFLNSALNSSIRWTYSPNSLVITTVFFTPTVVSFAIYQV